MKKNEIEDKLSEKGDPEGQVYERPEDAVKKALEIEQIDDSQLPQSIKDLFKK